MKFIGLILLLLSPVPALAAPPNAAQSAASDAIKEAAGLLNQGRFKEAADGFQRADELAGGSCGPCLLGLSRAQLALKQADRSADSARKAAAALHNPDLVAQAWNQLGMALMSRNRPDLVHAEEAFRKAASVPDGQLASVAGYNLADVLWRQKKYAESEQAAREALVAEPTGPASLNARIVLCQARADGAPVAPPEAVYACPKEGLRIFENKIQATSVESEVVRPEKLFGRPPVYDEGARMSNLHGTVMVESIIDEEGCVQKPRICKSVHPSLDLATLEAVRRWVFRPAELNGKPVKVYYTLTVNFTMGNSRSGSR